jgi:pyrroline-5-carboxylate reductase
MTTKLVIVGGGRMGEALLGGLIARNWAPPSDLAVVEPTAERRDAMGAAYEKVTVVDSVANAPIRSAADGGGVVLAVKPEVAESVCRALGAAGADRVLSVVAGLASPRLEAALGTRAVVLRAMPNTPALVGAGVAALSGGELATSADLDWAEGILSAVGVVLRLAERQLDAVTGLSGSGPAYIFLVAESLIEAGVLVGLPREVARVLAVQTILGSARLMAETGEYPEALRAAVTSPGGTTAAGLRLLEARGVRSAFLEAVASATERSRNLAR